MDHPVDHYGGKPAITPALYTVAEQFLGDATGPTESLPMVLTDALSRLAGRGGARSQGQTR